MSLTYIIAVYNEEETLPGLVEAYRNLWKETRANVLFVNDGSTDGTLISLESLSRKNANIGYIDLSRNFGKEQALAAGMSVVPAGHDVIVMDGDGQHTPAATQSLIAAMQTDESADVAFGIRAGRNYQSLFDKLFAGAFYKFTNLLLKRPLDDRLGDFFYARAGVVDTLKSFGDSKIFWKGVYNYIGYKRLEIPVEIAPRSAGASKYPFAKRLGLAVDGIVWLSKAPLHVISLFGLLISFLSFAFGFFIIAQWLLTGIAVPGFYTIIVLQSFGVGITMLSLGVMALYLEVIFENTSKKPNFIISSRKNLPAWDREIL